MIDSSPMAVLPIVAYELELGDGRDWRPLRVFISEALNHPYRAVVDAVCEIREADTDALLGANASLSLARGDHEGRVLAGIVEEIAFIGYVEHRLAIRLHIVPALALAQQRVRSHIWQQSSARDIVAEVLKAALGDYGRELELGEVTRGGEAREYCVQYRESDLDFCARLLEDEGICYEFLPPTEHGAPERMVLRDANTQYAALSNTDGGDLFPLIAERPLDAELESLQSLEWTRTMTSTAVSYGDYDWRTPTKPLSASVTGSDERGRTRSIYVHGARRFLADDLQRRSEDARDAAALPAKVARGFSNITGLRPGARFKVGELEREDLERSYIVTEVIHRGEAPDIAGELGLGGGAQYENEFECVPLESVLRPPRRTPKPRVYGPQTAIVTGESGEEITTDEHGRVKVQFHWEPRPGYDEGSSCWVRCSQSWAGLGWGAQFIPRVGMEVVVEFLEGDPDRPLVTGCVYNGATAPPFALPDNKTQSGLVTRSSPDSEGFNALRFEDAAGSEQVYLRAQKNLRTEVLEDAARTVGNDESREIGNDRTDKVGHDEAREVVNDQALEVGNDQSLSVGNDQSLEVGGDRKELVSGDIAREVGGDEGVKIRGKLAREIGGDQSVEIGGGLSEKVGGAHSLRVNEDQSVTVVGDHSLAASNVSTSADAKLSLESGGDAKLASGAKITLEAKAALALSTKQKASLEGASEVVLKCGGASITLKSSGDIVLKGTNISLDAMGALTAKGGSIANN